MYIIFWIILGYIHNETYVELIINLMLQKQQKRWNKLITINV